MKFSCVQIFLSNLIESSTSGNITLMSSTTSDIPVIKCPTCVAVKAVYPVMTNKNITLVIADPEAT